MRWRCDCNSVVIDRLCIRNDARYPLNDSVQDALAGRLADG
jgi:hypothetical protein